jgi:membrane-associated protease RseP (regulator of RpoE activity)
VTLLLAGPLANVVVGFAVLVGFDHWVGEGVATPFYDVYRQSFGGFVDFAQVNAVDVVKTSTSSSLVSLTYVEHALLLLGMVQLLVGLVSLIPLPPLEGGRLLFLFTPRSLGWQKAEYQLAERNIGLIIILVCLIRLSSGIDPPFAYLADVITHALALLSTHL